MINPRILVSFWGVNGHKAKLKLVELTVSTAGDLTQVTLICPLPNGAKTRMRMQFDKQSALEFTESICPSQRKRPRAF